MHQYVHSIYRTDISVSVDVKIGTINGTDGVFVAARVDKGGCQSFYANGVFFYIFPAQKKYYLTYDLGKNTISYTALCRIRWFLCFLAYLDKSHVRFCHQQASIIIRISQVNTLL